MIIQKIHQNVGGVESGDISTCTEVTSPRPLFMLLGRGVQRSLWSCCSSLWKAFRRFARKALHFTSLVSYLSLVEELLDFSYRNPSSGYVLSLALAVELALVKSWKKKNWKISLDVICGFILKLSVTCFLLCFSVFLWSALATLLVLRVSLSKHQRLHLELWHRFLMTENPWS